MAQWIHLYGKLIIIIVISFHFVFSLENDGQGFNDMCCVLFVVYVGGWQINMIEKVNLDVNLDCESGL